jgi:hypothetical protein
MPSVELVTTCWQSSLDTVQGHCSRIQKEGQALDAKVGELTIIALVSCFSLGLAWAYEADFFAMFLRRRQPSLGSRRFDDLCDAVPLRACSQARCALGKPTHAKVRSSVAPHSRSSCA